jgi:maltooligosyltrehalose trehalohydrolase
MVSRQSTPSSFVPRRYPIGVEVVRHNDGTIQTHARVWAPDTASVELVTYDDSTMGHDSLLAAEGNGYHSGYVPNAPAGTRYRLRVGPEAVYPDPASRCQSEGPHGPSLVVDHTTYEWSDEGWNGASLSGQVLCELHIGTFTKAGTFRGAIERLPDLVDTGITVLEIMPVAEFAGRFGWGYDGVNLFAPSHLYGSPDDFRAFVDAAHALELGVILDVVYNHFGPDGNYLRQFSRHYFSDRATDWGDALNFDGPYSDPVREYILTNARYWIEEFHLDGLRLDATQQIYDSSSPGIISEICRVVRAAAGDRKTIVIGENEPQDAALLERHADSECGLDGLWNDDFHHSAHVAATGRSEAFYTGYRGSAQEFVSAVKYGFLYQGEWYRWQRNGRGTPALDVHPSRFVVFLENHDQLANSSAGRRAHQNTSPGRHRALTALLLLGPQTPMLFQGQDFGASNPFLYFADHGAPLATMVREGRTKFLSQFWSLATPEGAARIDDPGDAQTFVRSKLDWAERRRNGEAVSLHRDLLRLRRDDAVLRAPRLRGVDGAVINDRAFVIRYFGGGDGDRLLIVNLGDRLHAEPFPEPLIAPPRESRWHTVFSTESTAYGGWGTPPVETDASGWWIPAECAVLMTSKPDE